MYTCIHPHQGHVHHKNVNHTYIYGSYTEHTYTNHAHVHHAYMRHMFKYMHHAYMEMANSWRQSALHWSAMHFLGPRGPLGTPLSTRMQEKSESPLKPYKSSQDHARHLVKRIRSPIMMMEIGNPPMGKIPIYSHFL